MVLSRLPSGESVARAGGGQRLKSQVRQQTCGADVPWIGNDEGAIALVHTLGRCVPFRLGSTFDNHTDSRSLEGMPKVPSTTSTKFLSSRRINALGLRHPELSRASGIGFQTRFVASYDARLSNAIKPQATSLVPS